MKSLHVCLRLACVALVAVGTCGAIPALLVSQPGLVLAQAKGNPPGSVELEEYLFVQAPEQDDGRGGIVLVWLPQPLLKRCLGKTFKECSYLDYCIRTTNRAVSMCKNLGVDLSRIPPYPPGMRPRQMMSLEVAYLEPTKFAKLQSFYRSAPSESLERLTMSARVKARIRFTRKPDKDDFELLDVLDAPPF